MREIQKYSLVDVNRATSLSQLARDGKGIGVSLTGVLIQAQFELPEGASLLWLTEDSPYDEGLHVYLIGNKNDELEDGIEAGATFSPGILEIKATGERWADFEFFQNGFTYRLEVLPRAGLRLYPPPGWRYKRLLSRHRMVVTVLKQEEHHG